jgi:hypothetical protein
VLPLEIQIENLGEMVVLDRAREQHLQRVAQKGQRVVVLEKERILLEDVAGRRILDVCLESD